MKNQKISALTVAIALALGLSGCGVQSGSTIQDQAGAQYVPSESSKVILGMYRGTSADVNLVDDPDLLTSQSQVIVEGEITGFATGREWQFGGPKNESSYSIVMAVRVSTIFKGADHVSSSTVYVEHFLSPDVTVETLNSSLVGYECGLFLVPAADEGYKSLVDSDAGRPAGQPLWVSGAQTFVVQDKTNSQVVWPQLDAVRQGTLAEAMPGGSLTPINE